jgi:hypothetical protein
MHVTRPTYYDNIQGSNLTYCHEEHDSKEQGEGDGEDQEDAKGVKEFDDTPVQCKGCNEGAANSKIRSERYYPRGTVRIQTKTAGRTDAGLTLT